MHKLEKNQRHDNMLLTPSFSSTLLDQIYRSIDDGERKSGEHNFYRHTTMSQSSKKQSKSNFKTTTTETETERKTVNTKKDRKPNRDEDVLFFSSTSISSDSSFGFSSSDTESMSRVSCFAPRPKVVRGSASFRAEKQGMRVFDGLCRNSHEHVRLPEEQVLIKSKSRALKIYNNLKKVKQPISPGGRVTSFLNSLFANTRKTSNSNSRACDEERVASSSCYYSSTCSSASSFSRSCLSKTLSSDRNTLRNGVKRTVRFYPVSVIVGEDSRPCGHKRLCEEKGASREFLREYQKKSDDLVLKELSLRTNVNVRDDGDDDDDDDDASSYASSDLFELDHLAAFGSERYCEELPVYETTHVSTNRAIANGLIL